MKCTIYTPDYLCSGMNQLLVNLIVNVLLKTMLSKLRSWMDSMPADWWPMMSSSQEVYVENHHADESSGWLQRHEETSGQQQRHEETPYQLQRHEELAGRLQRHEETAGQQRWQDETDPLLLVVKREIENLAQGLSIYLKKLFI